MRSWRTRLFELRLGTNGLGEFIIMFTWRPTLPEGAIALGTPVETTELDMFITDEGTPYFMERES